ncbi:MAG: hypothetical protein WAO55_09120 [Candidatus Manganitrophaceae bacterium]
MKAGLLGAPLLVAAAAVPRALVIALEAVEDDWVAVPEVGVTVGVVLLPPPPQP